MSHGGKYPYMRVRIFTKNRGQFHALTTQFSELKRIPVPQQQQKNNNNFQLHWLIYESPKWIGVHFFCQLAEHKVHRLKKLELMLLKGMFWVS